MRFAIFVSVIQICFFVSLVNYFFQKQKFNHRAKEERLKFKRLELPSTWLAFSVAFALILAGTLGLSIRNVANGYSNIKKQQTIIEQYKEDSSSQSTDDQTTDDQSNSSQTNN